MAGNPPWAPEEDQRLRALALSGASVAEMAKQIKRSEEAVHLVGAGEQRGGQFQAKRRGRLQVYDELKFRWLRHRQVRGFFPP
jgi:hypothetical protein